MLLGVSSMNCFSVVDVDNGTIDRKYDSNCYGFTFCDQYYFLKTSMPGKQKRANLAILVMDKEFNIVDKINERQDKIVRGHQMQYHVPSNKLWLTSPGEDLFCNDIYIYDMNKGECEIWTPIREARRLHYNSLCFKDDVLYILSHNYHVVPSILYAYNWETRELIKKQKLKYGDCHNIFYIDDDLFYCASKKSIIMNANGEEFIDVKKDKGRFIRGIAFNDQYLFVGSSNESVPGPQRLVGGQIFVYDIHNKKLIRIIDMPKTGAIHEVRILDGVDYAHTTEG